MYVKIYNETCNHCTVPPSVAAPKVCEVTLNSCLVDWAACKPMGHDTIVYVLQLQSRNHEYTQVQLPSGH